jgi:hypothetical protein
MPPPVLDCYAITPPGVEVLTMQIGLELVSALSTTNGGIRVRLLTGTVPAAA